MGRRSTIMHLSESKGSGGWACETCVLIGLGCAARGPTPTGAGRGDAARLSVRWPWMATGAVPTSPVQLSHNRQRYRSAKVDVASNGEDYRCHREILAHDSRAQALTF
jgi:hypothetical protein